MPNQITVTYIAGLVVCALLLLFLFWSYSKVFGKLIPFLNNTAGGFVLFIAVNEVVALPFTLLHLSFSKYLITFLLVNLPVFAFGLFTAVRAGKPKVDTKTLKSKYFILSIILLATCLFLVQAHSYYSGDDSFYVSLVEQNKDASEVYRIDPTTGNKRFAFPKTYRFQSWELVESGLSKITGLTTTELTYSLMSLIILPVLYLTFRKIFGEIIDNNDKYLALSFMLIMLIFGAYSLRSPAAFVLTRPWQGKSIVAAIILPLLTFALYRLYLSLKKKDTNWQLLAAAIVINTAALALNPSSVFLSFGATLTFGLMALIKYRRIKPTLFIGLSLAPYVPLIMYRFVTAGSSDDASLDILPYTSFLSSYVGFGAYFIIWALGLAFFYKSKIMQETRDLNYLYPALLLLTLVNPLLFGVITQVTSTAYWRLFWLTPMFIAVPIIGVLTVNYIFDSIKQKSKSKKSLYKLPVVILVILIFALAGRYVYGGIYEFPTEMNSTRSKVPAGVFEVAEFMKNQEHGIVLASEQPSIYLHNFTSKHEILAPRSLSVRVNYKKNVGEYNFMLSLIALMNERNINAFSVERFHQVIRRNGVEYIIYKPSNTYVSEYVEAFDAEEIFRSPEYIVVATKYLELSQ